MWHGVIPAVTTKFNEDASLDFVEMQRCFSLMMDAGCDAYRFDVTTDMLEELADDARFVAVKESSDDIRRGTEIINRLGGRYDLFTGVDNLAFEALAVGAVGCVAGLVVAFPKMETRPLLPSIA